ncbi:metal-binding protein [Polymorphobacter glacialis]|uniref:Metal-binding protein n=1 Tax=Sandarakinorhabdus glacialis TaxID=1614636 RepID=A0A916ZWP3_9SPHN|nr:YceD family protein [Polymorphobacter glacialis]GGE15206.1 metal-binding protein [Polymorphobacter glacialis]
MTIAPPEFSRHFRAHDVAGIPRQQMIEADPAEREALARRFNLIGLERLTAALELSREAAGIRVTGQIHASGDQACVATAEPVPFLITEPLKILLTEARPEGDEIELHDADLDTEILEGDVIDLGEIAAQALALALDPYPRSVHAAPGVVTEEQARADSSPFAILRKK